MSIRLRLRHIKKASEDKETCFIRAREPSTPTAEQELGRGTGKTTQAFMRYEEMEAISYLPL